MPCDGKKSCLEPTSGLVTKIELLRIKKHIETQVIDRSDPKTIVLSSYIVSGSAFRLQIDTKVASIMDMEAFTIRF